ncbi:MAG: 3-dehydroquinate synthase [Clostridia bacterium]
MRRVLVKTEAPYEVKIQRGLLFHIGEELLSALGGACKVAVLSDDTVSTLYGHRVCEALEASGFQTCCFAMKHGEGNKNLSTWQSMLDFLAREQCTRTDCVLALGGGVVGDTAGFAAASYLRGLRLVQVPTTLLAMVDSSVGGKTGVNLAAGKNLAGAFYQPCMVLCDPDALCTLPEATFADGAAEAVKYGMLGDLPLFELLASGCWHARTEEVIERCIAAKAALVNADAHDTGSRQLLNLGHTLGHAIEKCSGYAVAHGHAVAVGMVYATRLSVRLGLCKEAALAQLMQALQANGLPTAAPYAAKELCRVALSDKKRAGDQLTMVLPIEIGQCELHPVAVDRLNELVAMAAGEQPNASVMQKEGLPYGD